MALTLANASHSMRAIGLRLAAKASALKMRRFAEVISPTAGWHRVAWEGILHRLRSGAKPNASPCRWRPESILRRRPSIQIWFRIPELKEGHLGRVVH